MLMILIFTANYVILITGKEVRIMRCGYKDDFKVDYSSGALHVSKGSGVDLTVNESQIPANYKACLDSAVSRNSCHELRAAARGVTSTINKEFSIE
jgi:hypothetical protein